MPVLRGANASLGPDFVFAMRSSADLALEAYQGATSGGSRVTSFTIEQAVLRRANSLPKIPKTKESAAGNALESRLLIASTYDTASPTDVLLRSGAQLPGSVAALATRQEDDAGSTFARDAPADVTTLRSIGGDTAAVNGRLALWRRMSSVVETKLYAPPPKPRASTEDEIRIGPETGPTCGANFARRAI